MELCAAYAAIANGGNYIKPIYYTQILDHDGNVLIENSSVSRSVIKDSTAYLLTSAMEDVVKKGTGTACQLDNMAVAGKTGTTSLNKDGWFCGYTPYYTTAVWVGRDDNRIMESLSGASYPKSIWSNFMNAIHSEYSSTDSMGGNYKDYQGETTQQTGTQATTATESSTKGTEATTAASTTAAPTTAAPTTAAPTTAAPTTAAPQPEE